MNLSVGCSLSYQVLAPHAAFTFHVLAHASPEQRIVTEEIACTPGLPTELVAPARGDRLLRVEAPAGPFEFRYSAVVEVLRPPLAASVPPDRPGLLPLSILTYTLPSRYCESDLFSALAWEMFGSTSDRAEQVRAICRWVAENIAYVPGASDGRTSAWNVWQSRKGVCRDFVHLSIAFCRALTIPARYVGGYAAGLEPMDFHACFEVYLGGSWHLFDPTDEIPPDRMVIVSRGRDAAQAGLTIIYGKVQAGPVRVSCILGPEVIPPGITIQPAPVPPTAPPAPLESTLPPRNGAEAAIPSKPSEEPPPKA